MEERRRLRRRAAAAVAAVLALATGCSLSTSTSSSSASSSASSGGAPTHPNIVLVLTDDLSMDLISHMPHVVGLQKTGTTMADYHVVDSLCCPSRSAIFTGEYPHDDGVFTNSGADGGYAAYDSHGDEQRAFALSLQEAGYTTGFMGKYLNGYQPSDPVPPGWDTWDVTGDGYPEFGYTLDEDGHQQHYGHAASDYLVDVLSRKADSFVRTNAGHHPFMLEVATFAPHAPYTPAPRYAHAAQGLAYPRTPAYDAQVSDPPSWLADRAPLTAPQERELADGYRERVEADDAVDDLVAHLQSTLQAEGVARDTDVVFSSDNGYHMGEYRLLAGKQTAFDTDTHVPLIVSGPGVPAGRTDHHLVSNIDLAPTFEALAGAATGSRVDGVSMAGLWHGQSPSTWQRGLLIEHHGPDDARGDPDAQDARHADPPSYEAVRTAGALYVRYADGQQEYYDTAEDPYELHDLGASAVPAALRSMLSALQACHGAAACQAAAGATAQPRSASSS